jgi:hypothetical protein
MMDVVLKSHGLAHVKTTCIAPALKLFSIRQQKRWTAMLYASCQKNLSIYATSQTELVLVINNMLKQINLLKTKRNLLYKGISPYRAVNTFRQGYKNQSVTDV